MMDVATLLREAEILMMRARGARPLSPEARANHIDHALGISTGELRPYYDSDKRDVLYRSGPDQGYSAGYVTPAVSSMMSKPGGREEYLANLIALGILK